MLAKEETPTNRSEKSGDGFEKTNREMEQEADIGVPRRRKGRENGESKDVKRNQHRPKSISRPGDWVESKKEGEQPPEAYVFNRASVVGGTDHSRHSSPLFCAGGGLLNPIR